MFLCDNITLLLWCVVFFFNHGVLLKILLLLSLFY